jgi:hypothetical protein
MTAISVAVMNNGRTMNDGNSGIATVKVRGFPTLRERLLT